MLLLLCHYVTDNYWSNGDVPQQCLKCLSDGRQTAWYTAGAWDFSLFHYDLIITVVHPASYPEDTGGSFPGLKQPECESDHSPSSTFDVKVKNAWICIHTPSLVFKTCYFCAKSIYSTCSLHSSHLVTKHSG